MRSVYCAYMFGPVVGKSVFIQIKSCDNSSDIQISINDCQVSHAHRSENARDERKHKEEHYNNNK